jgi:hypothetical protein
MGAPGQAKTGGRKAGTPNKKTAALKQAVAEAVGALPDAFDGDSYAFLATVYKNQALPLSVRLDAAKTAIAYERARLAHVAMTTRSLDQLSLFVSQRSRDELQVDRFAHHDVQAPRYPFNCCCFCRHIS